MTTTDETPDTLLRECPFCGATDAICCGEDSAVFRMCRVQCGNCGSYAGHNYGTRAEAIEVWNTRYTSPPTVDTPDEFAELWAAVDDEWQGDKQVGSLFLSVAARLRSVIESQRREIERLRSASNALVTKLDEIAEATKGMFVLASVRGMPYKGPNWEQERNAISALSGKEE